MLKTMSAAALSFLLAAGGGVAFAETGGQPPPSTAASSQASGQHGARANAQGPVGFEEEEVQTAPWTVERIDKQNRNLVLRAPDGTQSTVNIPAGTPGFEPLKKGDKVQLDYFEAAVVGMPPSSAKSSAQPGPTSSSGQAAPSNSANRKIRSIRKVGHEGSTGQSGSAAPSTNAGGSSANHTGQENR